MQIAMPVDKNRGLAEIQPSEAHPGAHRRALVARHGAVEAIGLAPLIAEILDGLVIEQRVDRLGMGVSVGIVHLAADGDAPIAGAHREPDVEPHRHRDHADVPETELVPDDAGGQRELHDGRRGVQDAWRTMFSMPFVPRSMMRDSPPVRRSR